MVIKPHLWGQINAQVSIDSQRGAEDIKINTDAEKTETGAEEPNMLPPNQLRFEEYYQLSFGNPSSILLLSWFVGISQWDDKSANSNGGVNLQLGTTKSKVQKLQKGMHNSSLIRWVVW